MHEKALIKESVLETIRFRSTLNYGRNAHEHENLVTTTWYLLFMFEPVLENEIQKWFLPEVS